LRSMHNMKINTLKQGFFFITFISNIYHRINTYKFEYINKEGEKKTKQRFIKSNIGIVAHFQWLGNIILIEEATILIHKMMKGLKNEFSPIISEINSYLAGNDFTYNTIEEKEIVKDDLNENLKGKDPN
ncbi:unnamed protein product, partial [marine sediment metagenome]